MRRVGTAAGGAVAVHAEHDVADVATRCVVEVAVVVPAWAELIGEGLQIGGDSSRRAGRSFRPLCARRPGRSCCADRAILARCSCWSCRACGPGCAYWTLWSGNALRPRSTGGTGCALSARRPRGTLLPGYARRALCARGALRSDGSGRPLDGPGIKVLVCVAFVADATIRVRPLEFLTQALMTVAALAC